MNNGFTSDTPNVNRMLSTRGSRYRFDDLDEGNCGGRSRVDTLYVLPDPKFKPGNAKTCRIREEPAQICGSSSDIYVNERPESSEATSANNDSDDIYSEIKTGTNNTSQPLHYATYEDIKQDNKTDVNGNGRSGRGKDGSGRSDNAKGEHMELTDLAKTKTEDTYNVPKSHSRFNNQKSSDDRNDNAVGGGSGGDDRKNNNGDNDSIEGSRSKTCDSGIYIYLNSKEEEDEQEDENDIIYSVPYSNSNNNNSNNNNSNCSNNNNSPSHRDCIKCNDTRQPRKQRRAAVVQSHVYQNAMFDGEEAGHSTDIAKTNASSLSSSPSPSLSSSSSLQQWQNDGIIYSNVADNCCDDQTLYQDIDNTKNEVHV
ncbi:probable serine/threonine-protein kinase DDB_G0277165 [Octopus bimaculoides]|nr:probable serine/threonine-protein kinase DDB_G0277165 [Octopus bimaculoides]|eukprot:XP_014785322.1 PREDICTED: probable serine/threonine-protein kinase DDB_G0277165 [Octopus bimaculoides]